MRNRIDLAFDIVDGTQRRTVIEVGATVPRAVPGILLDPLVQLCGFRLATLRERKIVTQPRHLGEFAEDVTEEESEPHAFALAMLADEIHAVVPVAAADERQSMRAESQAVENRPHAMLVDARPFVGHVRQIVVRVVLGFDRAAFEKGRGFIENRRVAGGQDVPARGQWQPEIIVRAVRPYSTPRRRMPPMLDVTFDELPFGRPQ